MGFLIALIFAVLSFWGGIEFGFKLRGKEAIKNGHGEIVIADTVTGATEFRWKDKPCQ